MKREQRKAYNAIMKALTPIVEKTVKYYRTDFDGDNDYSDKTRLLSFCADPDKETRFLVWGARESGTDIGYKKSLADAESWLTACVNHNHAKWYEIDTLNGLVSPIKDINRYTNELRKDGKHNV